MKIRNIALKRAWTPLLKDHWQFFAIVMPLILLMTWPAIIHVFDTSRFWAPGLDWDAWMKFWDAWHLGLVLRGEADFFYSHHVFYPQGATLAFQHYSLPNMLGMLALGMVLPASNAFTILYLLNIFAAALSAYVYICWLLKDKWLAVVGAVVFGCSQWVMATASQPDLGTIATIPLSLYCLHRGVREGRARLYLAAGALLGFTAYCGLYVFVCNCLTIGFFALWQARSRWRAREYWLRLALMLMVAAAVSGVRIGGMLADADAFDTAIRRELGSEHSSDLLSHLINYRQPVLTPIFSALFDFPPVDLNAPYIEYIHGARHNSYLGYLPLLLIGVGLLRRDWRRRMLPWLALLLMFFVLRAGTALRIDDHIYEDIWLPKHYLNQLLPEAFAAFHRSRHFQPGLLLPLAVLTCMGLGAALDALPFRRRHALILLATGVIAFEIYYLPAHTEIDREQFAYIDWLAQQEDQESIRLVHLPMEPFVTSKMHLLHQSVHGYPQARGIVGRVSTSAYAYIHANAILADWSDSVPSYCQRARQTEQLIALEELIADGFSHIALLHYRRNRQPRENSERFAAGFSGLRPAYQDRHTTILRLSDLRDRCAAGDFQSEPILLYLVMFSRARIEPGHESLLSLHASQALSENEFAYLSRQASGWKSLNHVWGSSDRDIRIQSSDARVTDLATFAARNDSVWLLHDPRAAELEDIPAFRDGILAHFHACRRDIDEAAITVDYMLRRDFPCELVDSPSQVEARFDNGIHLRNALHAVDDDELMVYLRWSDVGSGLAYSIQVFDEHGDKVGQIERDAFLRREPLALHLIDVSTLPAGDYRVQLILYDRDAGSSYGGVLLPDHEPFERALEIARFSLPMPTP